VEESGDPRDTVAKRRRRRAAESSVRGGENASRVGAAGKKHPAGEKEERK
jgi:hypothetical protein